MPFRFRRSRNFGPFRVTASKSGLSGSVGAGGARVGRSRRGTWVSLGLLGTGLSWYRRYNRKRG
jgi:hypothetical protein